ncbi:YdbH family protein [Edwardsiella hoshinae]|uniref:Dicarboxylate transport n=1 Tax=Edwardsiella hoshinae TaxID=93378 RepID=A0A376DEY4_9GAMM|nr:YdbH family protein [Edwardsiella hoshinae]QPR27171.1 YdbH family protein [Edwardsiella hoshinae]STC88273.1 Dicarboxylate transport [Edwardsiella hoshinae]
MRRAWCIGALTLALVLSGGAAWWAMPHWLPRLLQPWLPAGAELRLPVRPYWSQGALRLPRLDYRQAGCPLLTLRQAALGYHQAHWQLQVVTLEVESRCFGASKGDATQLTLSALQQALPPLSLTIDRLTLRPWPHYGGTLRLYNQNGRQRLSLQGEQLQLELALVRQTLHIHQLWVKQLALAHALQLQGQVTLGRDLVSPPTGGVLQAQFRLAATPEPLHLRLDWQAQEGRAWLTRAGTRRPLLDLPWQQRAEKLIVRDGRWFWPDAPQALHGGVNLTLQRDPTQGWRHAMLQARLNMLSQGAQGKANLVMQLGPGRLDLQPGAFPLRLDGRVNHRALSFASALSAEVSGTPRAPRLRFLPGALLRVWGRPDAQTTIEEVRWPLAGVQLSAAGISGRLQAILRVSHRYWGRGQLHLDGQASAFRPDHGSWRWRYWGQGRMPPLRARWTVSGQGRWHDDELRLDQLSAGFDHLAYGLARVTQPRLTLSQPLIWRRSAQHAAFSAGFALVARRVDFNHGGYLPTPQLRVVAVGASPQAMQLQGALHAGAIGPIRLTGRWDGRRLRGQAWWRSQPMQVFQPLLAPSLGMQLYAGRFHAQAAFSAARGQGFIAGGHLQAQRVALWLKEGRVDGLDLTLPYRLHDKRWQLGPHGPATLRIDRLVNQFDLQQIRADFQGYYPYSEAYPLTVREVSARLFGGELAFSQLRLPQHQATVLRLHDIELSELITALKVKQFALSGRVEGALPLYLHNPQWIIHQGWFANTQPITLRLDKDTVDAVASNNLAGGAALDWLRYMEVGRSHARLDLSNLGELTLNATLYGVNRVKDRRRVIALNYRQRENVFQLWRSLRFGDNLQAWLASRLARMTRNQHE